MKDLKEIIKTQDYKSHVWIAAMTDFANTPDDGPSLYHDSFTKKDIIYHLRSSRKLNTTKDELAISDIKSFLSKLENVSEDISNAFNTIYDRYTRVAESFGYTEDYKFDFLKALKAYEVDSFNELWGNTEFKDQFTNDKNALVSQLRPIQDIVREL